MIFTIGQLNAARDGILIFNKWDNEKGEGSAKAVLPYQFDNKINKDEQLIVKSVIQRFNKDMKTCLEIKYVLICLRTNQSRNVVFPVGTITKYLTE